MKKLGGEKIRHLKNVRSTKEIKKGGRLK